MTSPCERIVIKCPSCGRDFEDWWRASINQQLDHFDDKYLEAATVKTCPHCGAKIKLDTLIVGEDGVWRWGDAGN